LTDSKIDWLESVLKEFSVPRTYKLSPSSFLDLNMLERIGDALLVHHSFSQEPFTEDRFEYVLEQVCRKSGRNAYLAPKGNPGHDITIDKIRFSLKTQADSSIKLKEIHISKFMELGKGKWGTDVADLHGLRDQFLKHMQSYDRILILRNLRRHPKPGFYELVELPKNLLEEARDGAFEMMQKSPQNPKPGYCRVFDRNDTLKFELYFDGGGERKLQIRHIRKDLCFLHATWDLAGGRLPLEG
jgi:type II restriction enzyme